jgi:hypothetical protein
VGGGGALLAFEGKLILAVAADAVAIGDDLGRLDHRHPQRRVLLEQPRLGDAVAVQWPDMLTSEMDSTPPPMAIGVPHDDLLAARRSPAGPKSRSG